MFTYLAIRSENEYKNHQDSISTIFFILFDKKIKYLINMVVKARENARSVQEHISRELWLSVNKFFFHLTEEDMILKYRKSDPITIVNELLQFSHIYYSVADITQEKNSILFYEFRKIFRTSGSEYRFFKPQNY